jgi:hypothetical protein
MTLPPPPRLDPLEFLVAKEAIVDTIHRLFIGTDNRDWAMVEEALAPRVYVDMTSLAGGEPAEMRGAELARMWEEGLRPIQAVHHQTGNFRVTVKEDRAEAFCYGTATHYRPTQSGRNLRTFVGSYDFVLARLVGRWRITRFQFHLKYVDGNLELDRSE